jgi:hypothetical protein
MIVITDLGCGYVLTGCMSTLQYSPYQIQLPLPIPRILTFCVVNEGQVAVSNEKIICVMTPEGLLEAELLDAHTIAGTLPAGTELWFGMEGKAPVKVSDQTFAYTKDDSQNDYVLCGTHEGLFSVAFGTSIQEAKNRLLLGLLHVREELM